MPNCNTIAICNQKGGCRKIHGNKQEHQNEGKANGFHRFFRRTRAEYTVVFGLGYRYVGHHGPP